MRISGNESFTSALQPERAPLGSVGSRYRRTKSLTNGAGLGRDVLKKNSSLTYALPQFQARVRKRPP